MQRWIVLGALILALLGGLGIFARWHYHQNQPDRVWYPLPLKEEVNDDNRKAFRKQLDEVLRRPAVLSAVVKDLNLISRFGAASEEAAVKELSQRLFVEIGEANPPSNRGRALNVGVTGLRKEHALLNEITSRLMKDVFKSLNIKDPEAAPF